MADIYIGNVKGPQGATGATGAQGPQGDAATIAVGTVSTTAYGNTAQVTNTGTSSAAVFDFVIPQGRPGEETTTMSSLTLDTVTAQSAQYPVPATGESGSVVFGKIIKFFNDIKTAINSKINYSDCVNGFTSTSDSLPLAAAAGKTLNDKITTMQTRTACTITTANSSVITHISGSAYSIPVNSASVIVFMDLGFKTTAARSANTGIFYHSVGGKKIKAMRPTALTCVANGDGVTRLSGIADASGSNIRYFTAPVNWTANTNFTISGVFVGDLVD